MKSIGYIKLRLDSFVDAMENHGEISVIFSLKITQGCEKSKDGAKKQGTCANKREKVTNLLKKDFTYGIVISEIKHI